MDNIKRIIINIDMKRSKETLNKIVKLYGDAEILLIIDPNLIYKAAEFLVSNGWLGEETVVSLKNILLKNLHVVRKKWINFAKKIHPNIKIKEIDGEFQKILQEKIEKENITDIIIIESKTFNPYWNIVKNIINKLLKKYNYLRINIMN